LFLQMRCRTSVVDVLRGSEFATTAGCLVRVLFKGGCVSVVILFDNSKFGGRRFFFGTAPANGIGQQCHNASKWQSRVAGDWVIPRPFTETSCVQALK